MVLNCSIGSTRTGSFLIPSDPDIISGLANVGANLHSVLC